MSGSQDRERMNSLFQEIKKQTGIEPFPSVNEEHELTLSWDHENTSTTLSIGETIYLVTTAPGKLNVGINLNEYTDSEIVEILKKRELVGI